MTTTDPTPLAEQIAREHWVRAVSGVGPVPVWTCECGTEGARDEHETTFIEHIATVTERAARERIAAEIEAVVRVARGGTA